MIASLLAAMPLLLASTGHDAPAAVIWRCSTADSSWVDKGLVPMVASDVAGEPQIKIDPSITYQEIKGWGGCFNELGWDALSVLDDSHRKAVMASLFDPKEGCKFNICRMPIGSSDFAMGYYSLDDNAGDYAMTHFSIDRDKQRLIPYIKAAMSFQPKLRVWGSPWSPPSWMTTNGNYTHGSMTQTPQNLSAYALYLQKAVEAYQAEGIHFFAVHVQNEANYNDNVYPQCHWTGAELRDFIKDYLAPQFKTNKVKAEIWAGTYPIADWDGYPGTVLADPHVLTSVHGVGYQWSGRELLQRTHDLYPQLELMETEMECGDGTNKWDYGEYTYDLMREYLDGWVGSFMQWNMILDETGKSHWGWAQNSMISINRQTKTVTYNPQFYAAKHFSYYVAPHANRIATTGTLTDQIAFRNPNGDVVLVVKNGSAAEEDVTVQLNGQSISPSLPAHSINTFVFRSSKHRLPPHG